MNNSSTIPARIIVTHTAALAWIALVFQFYLVIVNRVAPLPETIIRFFGYFTVLSNILVATCFTLILIEPGSGGGRFFAKPATLTAVTVYITVVGIIYNAILRFLWSPKGLQLVVDELLHSIVPVLVIVYWAIAVPGQRMKYK